jgi:hypothetical protein
MNNLELAKLKANLLSEIGDASNPLNYKETSNETTPISTRVKYEFSIGEDTYIVGMSITKLDLEEPENKDLPKGSKAMAVYFGLKQKNSIGDYTSSTNKGDQYKIMATVSQIIKNYVKDHPEIIEIKYETDDKARHRLYKAYLKSNNSPFKNWDIKEKGDWIYVRKPIEKKKGLFQRMFK